jgi:hypothetical protein
MKTILISLIWGSPLQKPVSCTIAKGQTSLYWIRHTILETNDSIEDGYFMYSSNDELSLSIVEIVCWNFKVKLQKHLEWFNAKKAGAPTGAGPLRIRPAVRSMSKSQ